MHGLEVEFIRQYNYDKTTYPHNYCHFWAAFVIWKILKEHSSTQVSEPNYQHVVYQDL